MSNTIKKYVILEIEVDKDIDAKYPNFIWNYSNPESFMANEIGSLNKGYILEDIVCYKKHSQFWGRRNE